MNVSSSRVSFLLKFLFYLSGLTSLIYEIVWTRTLTTVIGNTSLAVSSTVAIFLAGLALGSFFGGRMDRLGKRPIQTYGILEIGIGCYSVFVPLLVSRMDGIYSMFYPWMAGSLLHSALVKAALAAVVLLLPTMAMGATLPVLIRFYDAPSRNSQAALLYGLNTAGAVAGALLAGYLLIPAWGMSATIYGTASLNVLIGISSLSVGRPGEPGFPESPARPALFEPLYLLFAIGGFTTLAYEILWTRSLIMFFGSSVYAFSCILAVVLLGMAWGSLRAAGRIPEGADPYQVYSLLQFRTALSVLFFVAVFMTIPGVLIRIFQISQGSFFLFQVGQFVVVAFVILYSTFLAGVSFPAALCFFRSRREQLPAIVANIYSYSTIGSILGSLCAGFVLIPALGAERSIRIVALINLLAGMFCFRKTAARKQSKRVLMIGAIALFLLIFLPPWNQSVYNSGLYGFAYKFVSGKTSMLSPARGRPGYLQAGFIPSAWSRASVDLIYYAEGLSATVAVAEDANGIRSLLINGKPDASNHPTGDMRTQLLLGHLPVLVGATAHKVLVIGLGSGVTAGAVSVYKPERIDCVEIEKKVTGAARFFDRENRRVLDQPAFHLVFDDGRNFVQHTTSRYDFITSEPSNLWMSGVGNLFTEEFFRAAKSRLHPHGILCQWIHLYQISREDVFVFLKTFHSVFPYVSIWIDDADMLVLGRDVPMRIDPGRIQQILAVPQIEESLGSCGITVGTLLKRYAGDQRAIDLVDSSVPLNTDDRPVLEYSAPKSLFINHSQSIAQSIRDLQSRVQPQRHGDTE